MDWMIVSFGAVSDIFLIAFPNSVTTLLICCSGLFDGAFSDVPEEKK